MIKTERKSVVVSTKYICEILKKQFSKKDLAFEVHNYTICTEGLALLPDVVKSDKQLMYIVTSWFATHPKISFKQVNLNKGWWVITQCLDSKSFQEITNVTGEWPSEKRNGPGVKGSVLKSLSDCIKEIATYDCGWHSWILHNGILVKYLKGTTDLTHTKTFDGVRTDDDLLPISYLSRVENKDGTLSYYLSIFKEDWGPFKADQSVGIINLNFRTGEWSAIKSVRLQNGKLEADCRQRSGRIRIQFETKKHTKGD